MLHVTHVTHVTHITPVRLCCLKTALTWPWLPPPPHTHTHLATIRTPTNIYVVTAYDKAKHDYVWICDSGIRTQPNVLR